MKATQLIDKRWLHLRWCHCYQWKNLLDQEREARQHLEKQHQQQLYQLLLTESKATVGAVMRDQLTDLGRFRREQQQNRLLLKARQAQEIETFKQQLAQGQDWQRFSHFESLSVLRRS